jgi:pimeloyl-ACP methyl ester carboxylesterase
MYREPPLSTALIAGRTQSWRAAGPADGTPASASALPLVLLHGIGSNARAWAGQFAGFADTRRVIAWNAPGYAGSAPLPFVWPTPDDYAAALAQLLDHLGIARCVLVGQSLGAVQATAFALGAPGRVAALVLASPASGYGVARGDPLPDGVARRIADVETLGPAGLADARYARLLGEGASAAAHAIVRRAMAEVAPHGYAQAARLLAAADLPRAVTGLQVPVTTLWGSLDRITPPDRCAAVAAATPGGRFQEIPGGGHAVATECPDAFNQALRPILAEADAREKEVA